MNLSLFLRSSHHRVLGVPDGNYAGDHVQPFPPVARASLSSTHRSSPLSTAAVIAAGGASVTVHS